MNLEASPKELRYWRDNCNRRNKILIICALATLRDMNYSRKVAKAQSFVVVVLSEKILKLKIDELIGIKDAKEVTDDGSHNK